MNTDENNVDRKKLFVNREVQGAILLRSVMRWCLYLCAILLAVVIWTAVRDPSQIAIKLVFKSFVYFSPAIVASIILLPLFLFDVLKDSHRTVGPILPLRKAMANLADGQEIKPLKFRKGDHWFNVAEEFNVLANQVMAERRATRESSESQSRQPEAIVG